VKQQARAFILQNTRLQPVPLVPELQLHLADEILPLWRLAGEQGDEPAPLPFWACVWVGGQALARYLLDHPEEVAGKRVLDFASGSGLCAIAAMKAGAAHALAADIDPIALEAVALNAQANGVSVDITNDDLLSATAPPTDLILAGDVCYEKPLAARVLPWLRAAHTQGTRVLIGDPGRPSFPRDALIQLARYPVPTSRELEDAEVKITGVFTFPPRPDEDP
jgi:predicted nicotinamide N-methyase